MMALAGPRAEVDHHRTRLALHVGDLQGLAIALLQLQQQGQGVWSLTKRMVSPGRRASSAPKMAAWRKRLAMPRASKGWGPIWAGPQCSCMGDLRKGEPAA
jgi:hypothetical protein